MAATCGRRHSYIGYTAANMSPSRKASPEEVHGIVHRLSSTHTASSDGSAAKQAERERQQKIDQGRRTVDEQSLSLLVNRLHTTDLKGHQMTPRSVTSERAEVSGSELDSIVDRLYSSHTKSSGGTPAQPRPATNCRPVSSEDDIQAIYARLHTTHTKSSAGETSCKEIRTPNPPGFGLKMYTNVEGIETRFLGGTADDGKVNEVIGRLTTAQTTSSQARRDPLRILLYPECTSLHNNVQRIRDYQQTGSVTKQTGMERRERWYN